MSLSKKYSMKDWLELHKLTSSEVREYCDFLVESIQHSYRIPEIAVGGAKLSLLIEECLEHIILPSLSNMLNLTEAQLQKLSLVPLVQHQDGEIETPYTEYDEKNECPIVHLVWEGKPDDLICLAHEMAHAAQMILSDGVFMPPVAREVCAFLGELALIEFTRNLSSAVHQELCLVWHNENTRYFGVDAVNLAEAVEHEAALYNYRYNYPLARFVSIYAFAVNSRADVLGLFKSGSSAMQLLEIERFFQRSSQVLNIENNIEDPWSLICTIFEENFQSAKEEINAANNNVRLHILEDYSCDKLSIFYYNKSPLCIKGQFDRSPAGLCTLGRALTYILSHKMPPNVGARDVGSSLSKCLILEFLANYEADTFGGDIPVNLSDEEQQALGLILSLSPDALYEVLLGNIRQNWISGGANVMCVGQNNNFVDPASVPSKAWRKWRSMGIFALAALEKGEANIPAKKFLDIFEAKAAQESVHEFSTLWPWVKPREFDAITALGMAIHQLASSPYHSQFDLSQYIPVELLPPILNRQFKCFVDQVGQPLGIVSWAWLEDKTKNEVHNTGRALAEDEWTSGDHLFFNDWITGKQCFRAAMSHMTGNVFPDEIASSLRRSKDGSIRKINKWVGKDNFLAKR